MKFNRINPKNVEHFVPSWVAPPIAIARTIDKQLDRLADEVPRLMYSDWDASLKFWIELTVREDRIDSRVAEPDSDDDHGSKVSLGRCVIQSGAHRIAFPLNDVLKGAPNQSGAHCVYVHILNDDRKNTYVGVTGKRWFDRFAQHQSSARSGSHLLFHKALEKHKDAEQLHMVLLSGLDYEFAMQQEEDMVFAFGLYPNGLNMIPGGFAGIKYLSSLGLTARTAEERDDQVERISGQSELLGRPNPLCAARWAGDQEFVNRIVCGHTNRLTIDQVRRIRMLSQSGLSIDVIASHIGDSRKRVQRVVNGTRYSRAA